MVVEHRQRVTAPGAGRDVALEVDLPQIVRGGALEPNERAEHWNAEFLGWHVTKRGTRFEATQALAMAVRQQFGHLCAGAARGLALRHDHGSNFMAEHVQKQARVWGISPSCAFVAEPETNGVIERVFRTLKEQAIDGRVFQTIDDVRDAVRAFAARYNAEWLIGKNGYRSPLDARAARLDTTFRRAA
jgi:transposase InsO family protein